jgi:hypothetical protein
MIVWIFFGLLFLHFVQHIDTQIAKNFCSYDITVVQTAYDPPTAAYVTALAPGQQSWLNPPIDDLTTYFAVQGFQEINSVGSWDGQSVELGCQYMFAPSYNYSIYLWSKSNIAIGLQVDCINANCSLKCNGFPCPGEDSDALSGNSTEVPTDSFNLTFCPCNNSNCNNLTYADYSICPGNGSQMVTSDAGASWQCSAPSCTGFVEQNSSGIWTCIDNSCTGKMTASNDQPWTCSDLTCQGQMTFIQESWMCVGSCDDSEMMYNQASHSWGCYTSPSSSPPEIILIVIGLVIGIVLCIAVYCMYRYCKKKTAANRQSTLEGRLNMS